jgi:pimeloyl-ACP methyl ester carboxylesterase
MSAGEHGRSEISLPQGTLRYREVGEGPPIVFVHGLLVDGALWDGTVEALGAGFRCLLPDLPFGSHRLAMDPGADLTPTGMAKLVADFMERLELEEVTLVGNDSGGAVSQIVATRHPERLARLVLTPCDAYETFPPRMFAYLKPLARIPGGLAMIANSMRLDANRRSPLAYGWLTKRRIPSELLERWTRPVIEDRGVRRDTAKVIRDVSNRYTLEAARRLPELDRPALIVWAADDRFFDLALGRRLAADIPDARFELVEDSRTFLPLDQPERLAELIAAFVERTAADARAPAA